MSVSVACPRGEGAHVQNRRSAGTTSVWLLRRTEGREGSAPRHVMRTTGLPGSKVRDRASRLRQWGDRKSVV